jgi:hypothetical protein
MAQKLMTRTQHPEYSLPSILAIVSGIASLFFGAFMGLLLAVAAIILGIIGMLLAASPSIRGGIISIMSILAGLIGIIAAVFKLFF